MVVPKDGVFQKLNLITEKFGMTMERDKYSETTVSKAKDSIRFTLASATPGTAHTTHVTFTGLAPGSYDILINGSKTGTVSSVGGKPVVAALAIGEAARYEIELQQGDGPEMPEQVDLALSATASASYVSPWESLAGLNDGYEPVHSADRGHPVYGNWDNPGTTQWVQYDWNENVTIDRVDVYWFDDDAGIDLPASYSVQYWNGSAWVGVGDAAGYGVLPDRYNTTTFAPVTTNRIRLNVKAKVDFSTGIQSWRVYGPQR